MKKAGMKEAEILKRIIFIGGPPRGGTTVAIKCLNFHPGFVAVIDGHVHGRFLAGKVSGLLVVARLGWTKRRIIDYATYFEEVGSRNNGNHNPTSPSERLAAFRSSSRVDYLR
jgi:hypothetical protein